MHLEGKLPELLIPASSLDVLKTAVRFGADAVYLGGEAFSLRAKAKNFTIPEMREGIAYAHERGVKVYVTVNILAHNADLTEAENYLRELRELAPDALLVADPGIFVMAREICPELDLHISTQANNVNYGSFLFWQKLGASRVVCGRELSLQEIREIRDRIPDELEIEAFVHGAMCISYSGRCLVSNYLTGRDANRGACTHPCRWNYQLFARESDETGEPLFSIEEATRPGERMPLLESERGTFLFNSKDLCMIEHIPDMVDAGIDSLKIEGRMKTALYVAVVAGTYRKALDDLKESREKYEKNMDLYKAEIRNCTYREFTTGFFYGKPGYESQIYDSNSYVQNAIYLGTVEAVETHQGKRTCRIRQKNKFCVGDRIEIMKPGLRTEEAEVLEILDEELGSVMSAPHSKHLLHLVLSREAEEGDLLRMKRGA